MLDLLEGSLPAGTSVADVQRQLAERPLACHCSPALCHGHVLACVANGPPAELASLRVALGLSPPSPGNPTAPLAPALRFPPPS